MRKLYWKIFLSFWLATILIIISTAWVTQKSSIPAHERMFMDSHVNAAVATFESGKYAALKKWLSHTGNTKHMTLYLLTSTGEIIGNQNPPGAIKQIADNLANQELDDGLLKFGNIKVSHEILSTTGIAYRLAAVSEKPLTHVIEFPWAGLTIRIILAIFISGLICYLLSLYLTHPLRSLQLAAQSIATGKLSTRVGRIKGHQRDEIAELSNDFDRMAEQLETIVNSKERLLQDISHELRSPLARLQIAIALGRKKASTRAEAEFSRMEIECQRLNTLITEILEFARLDKTSRLNRSAVDLPQLVKQIIADANYELDQHEEKIKLIHCEPCTLLLDERLIHRCLENIIRNAIRYSLPHPQVSISLYTAEENTEIYIDIKDNGPGVPEKELTKIFSPFYRVDSSREKSTGGYGLGLSIAQRAIKLHGGHIKAFNCTPIGFLVRVCLPLSLGEATE